MLDITGSNIVDEESHLGCCPHLVLLLCHHAHKNALTVVTIHNSVTLARSHIYLAQTATVCTNIKAVGREAEYRRHNIVGKGLSAISGHKGLWVTQRQVGAVQSATKQS